MKYYIATRLENHAAHNELRDELTKLGHEITYDWTTHGPVWRSGVKVIAQTAVAEMEGVRSADFVIVLLPGGRRHDPGGRRRSHHRTRHTCRAWDGSRVREAHAARQ